MESKITRFGSRFAKKLKSKNYVEFPNAKREKTEIKSTINLFYDSKLKSDVIRRDIRRKTLILTQDSARNDPIDHRIKSFSFHNFEDDRRYSRRYFSIFSQ